MNIKKVIFESDCEQCQSCNMQKNCEL